MFLGFFRFLGFVKFVTVLVNAMCFNCDCYDFHHVFVRVFIIISVFDWIFASVIRLSFWRPSSSVGTRSCFWHR